MIDACVELLDEEGRSRLSRARIARRAGVSLPALNRRFDSVEAIIEAIAATPMHEPGSLPETDSLREHLVARTARAVATLERLPIRRSAAEIVAAATGSPSIDAAFATSLASVRGPSLRLIECEAERGGLKRDCDGELLLDLLDGALYYRLLWRGERLTSDEVEPLVDAVLAGFLP